MRILQWGIRFYSILSGPFGLLRNLIGSPRLFSFNFQGNAAILNVNCPQNSQKTTEKEIFYFYYDNELLKGSKIHSKK